jgi:hypothetical protein
VQQSRDDRLSFFKIASTRIGEGFTLRGYAARLPHLANFFGEREAQKQQSPPVAGRDAGVTGEIQKSVAGPNLPEIRTQVKRKKALFRNGWFCADFRLFYGRVAL